MTNMILKKTRLSYLIPGEMHMYIMNIPKRYKKNLYKMFIRLGT